MLTKVQKGLVLNELTKLGLGSLESEVYLNCLKTGPHAIQEIARSIKENRVTVYSAVERLLEKGLLTETYRGKRRLILVENPGALRVLYQKQLNELHALQKPLNELIPFLESIQQHDQSKPSVKFYDGIQGLKTMLELTLTAKGEVLVFTYVDTFSKLLDPNYLEDYFQRRSAKGIHTRLIFPPCPFAERVNSKAARYKIQVRLLPPHLKWQSGIFSWNDCLGINSLTEGRAFCTIIENTDISYFYRNIIFELCWKAAKPIQ